MQTPNNKSGVYTEKIMQVWAKYNLNPSTEEYNQMWSKVYDTLRQSEKDGVPDYNIIASTILGIAEEAYTKLSSVKAKAPELFFYPTNAKEKAFNRNIKRDKKRMQRKKMNKHKARGR